MAEKITIGNAELWHGDCREVLPLLQGVDAIVSDPPYGIGYQHRGGGKGKHTRRNGMMPIAGDDAPFDPTPMLGFAAVLLFGADYYRDKLPAGGTFVAWDKSCGIGPADSFADAEFAWTNAKVKRNVVRYLWKGICGERAGEERGTRYHPTQKPVGLMQRCVELVNGETVCDPYMGSGSTGVACMRLGRKFVGIEIERKYFDIACERIENEQRQARLAV